jgi:pyruvate/2-oxoglutarate dehydrogenase complex dihydrolipoamide dehydrogenase (E3) component
MTADYDLVVIGDSPEGIYAASIAASLKARVALVKQPSQGQVEWSETIFRSRFAHINRLSRQLELIYGQSLDFPRAMVTDWGREVRQILAERESPAWLCALGVDVIPESGEMVRLPALALAAGSRKLYSQAYLIATGSTINPQPRADLEAVGYLTPDRLWQGDKLAFMPDNLTIIAGTPLGVELAQNLRRIGKKVTLVIENESPLNREEAEIVKLLYAQLEAEGIEILTSSVTQVKRIGGKKWLQAGERAIESDEIILAPQLQPNIKGLNLAGVGVKFTEKGVQVNHKLQTTNPKIYACGSVIGGYSYPHLAQYEADIAVKNALFIPLFKVNYGHLPYVFLTDPPLARVGMTENQAKKYYRGKTSQVQQGFSSIIQAQILGETTGLCKIVLHKNGDILGASILGAEAGESINIIALAMKQKIKISKLTDLFSPASTFAQLVSQTALKWKREQFKQQKTLNHWLENWLIWRRIWLS